MKWSKNVSKNPNVREEIGITANGLLRMSALQLIRQKSTRKSCNILHVSFRKRAQENLNSAVDRVAQILPDYLLPELKPDSRYRLDVCP